jgi:hypothetical protein
MNLFDAHSIVSNLGLAGVLAIVFAETGLLFGLSVRPRKNLLLFVKRGQISTGTGRREDRHGDTAGSIAGEELNRRAINNNL